jgi:hypothetical protein
MAYVIAAPEMMEAASTDLATIGSTLNAAHMGAAASTFAVVPAAADEVSVGVARLFSQHAQGYQASARQAAAFQEQFAQNLKTSAASYTSIEDAVASLLQRLDAKVRYFEGAGTALRNIFVGLGGGIAYYFTQPPGVIGFFAPIFFPLVARAFVVDIARLILEVITGQPISYSAP